MKTYQFILSITNSTIIEVQADDYEKALNLANIEAFETDAVKYLCNPSDVEAELKSMEEENLLRVWTYFDGTEEDVSDFVREWETLLGTNVTADLTIDSEGGDSWYCEAFVDQQQIDDFNMDEDWFTIQ